MPFINIVSKDNNYNNFSIEVWPRSPGMLDEDMKITIFEKECGIYFYFINGKNFRVTIINEEYLS
jgi:hypothetical protein